MRPPPYWPRVSIGLGLMVLATLTKVAIFTTLVTPIALSGCNQVDNPSLDYSPPRAVACDDASTCDAVAGSAGECRVWACVDGRCEAAPADGGRCSDDGQVCTDDRCVAGVCSHILIPAEDCDCEGLSCPPAGVYGDSLQLTGPGVDPVETVEVILTDGFAVTCGGFGLNVLAGSSPNDSFGTMRSVAGLLPRCQNVIAGPMTSATERALYVTNHGDAYVPTPTLWHLSMNVEAGAVSLQGVKRLAVSPEGVAFDEARSTLWVAVHGAGVSRYDVDSGGALTLRDTLEGFTNANRLRIGTDFAYVADGAGGLKVVELATGAIVADIPTPGFARDVALSNGMALVAVSGSGVTAIDVTSPTTPELITTLFTDGQALQVEVFDGGSKLAVANWTDVVILDIRGRAALKLLAVDKGSGFSGAPRLLAVAGQGKKVVAADWLGTSVLRWVDGLIGPEIHINRRTFSFIGLAPGDTAAERFQVTNRGHLTLNITSQGFTASEEADGWAATPSAMTLLPGESKAVTVLFEAPAGETTRTTRGVLRIDSDDPDEAVSEVRVVANPQTGRMGVGDALTTDFDFLDVGAEQGQRSVQNLRGHVVLLAYFATF